MFSGKQSIWMINIYILDLDYHYHGPLVRYAKLRLAYASGMPGTFFPVTAG